MPALHDHVITAKLNVSTSPAALQEAQLLLESVLVDLESRFAPTPAGVGISIAWGLPYFEQFIPSLGKSSDFFEAGTQFPAYLPIDVVTSKTKGESIYALQDARTFPSDTPPPGFGPVRLEQNDVAVLLRSDSLANITSATNALFGTASNQAGSLFTVTSIRQGFAGGGFYGQQGLPSKLALAAGIPGAESIPRQSPLFLGFTSTLVSNMGPDVIANLETLPGLTDQWPNGYFKQGTTMHLSHLYEDLETWYKKSFPTYEHKVQAIQYPGVTPKSGTFRAPAAGPKCETGGEGRQALPLLRPQWEPLGSRQHRLANQDQLRRDLPRRHHRSRARRLQHARQSIPVHIGSDGRPLQQDSSGRVALLDVPTNHRDLQ